MSLDASNIQREKIVFELVKPFIPGFSVEPMEVDATSTGDQQPAKRKAEATEMEISTAADEAERAPTEETSTSKVKAKKNKKSKK